MTLTRSWLSLQQDPLLPLLLVVANAASCYLFRSKPASSVHMLFTDRLRLLWKLGSEIAEPCLLAHTAGVDQNCYREFEELNI